MESRDSTPEPTAAPAKEHRQHRALVWILIVVATVIAFVAIATTWVDRQMLDNHAWKNASKSVAQDPAVRSSVATYLVNQLYDNVDVAAGLEQRLPASTKQLAAPLAAALREPAARGAELLLERPRIQALWVNSSVLAHEKLVNVLENKTGHGIATGNGVVTLDLRALVVEIGAELGLPAAALDKIPADAGKITLLKSDQLSAAQDGVQAVRVLSAWLLVLVFGLYALAIYLARGARREALRSVGWSLVIVGLAVLVLRRVLGNYVTDTLSDPAYHGTVRHVWLIGTEILGQIGGAAILYGVVTVLAASLAGPSSAAVGIRRAAAPVVARHAGLAAAAVAAAYLLLVLWAPTHALRMWWGILAFGILIAAGALLLKRQLETETPDVPDESDHGPTLRARLADARAPKAATNGTQTKSGEIADLAKLHDSGALSDEEFTRAKAHVLE